MNSILVVTTPAESEELTVLATVKAELEITDDAFDARLATYITQASAICADYCNTTFGLASYTETFLEGTRSDRLVLARRPISTLTSVTEADQALAVDTDYMIDKNAGMLQRLPGNSQWWGWNSGWGWGQPQIVVVYEAGYALLDGLDPAIERACIELVKSMHYAGNRDPSLVQLAIPGVIERRWSASRGDVSAASALPKFVTDLLQPFRRFA